MRTRSVLAGEALVRKLKRDERQRKRRIAYAREEIEDQEAAMLRAARKAARLRREMGDAIEGDRRFFSRRPDRMHRIRIACEAEITELGGRRLPYHLRWFVVVRQIKAGARIRVLIASERDAETDLSERCCQAVYSLAADDRCPEIEAVARRVLS